MNLLWIYAWLLNGHNFFLTTLLGCYWYTVNYTNLKYTIWWILIYVYTPETIMHNQDDEYIHPPNASSCPSLSCSPSSPKPSSGNHGSAVTIDYFPFPRISIEWCFEGGICLFYRAYSSWDSPCHCLHEQSTPSHCWAAFQSKDLSIHLLADTYITFLLFGNRK